MAVGTAFLNSMNDVEDIRLRLANLGYTTGQGARDIHTFFCLAPSPVEDLGPHTWHPSRNPIPSTATRVIILAAAPMDPDEAAQFDEEAEVENISWVQWRSTRSLGDFWLSTRAQGLGLTIRQQVVGCFSDPP